MKVAITSRGLDPQDPVDPRFGRATVFVVFDTETGEHTPLENSGGMDAAHGAGIQAARRVQEAGVSAVVTGHCGPNAFRALSAAGIDVIVGAQGTVAETFARYQAGDLQPVAAPDVEGHGL